MEPTLEEMYVALKNQVTAGTLKIDDLEKGLGMTLLKAADNESLLRLKKAEDKVGNISDFISGIESERAKSFVSLKEAALKEKFKDEDIREAASSFFNLKSGSTSEINQEIERISELKILTNIAALKASAGNYQTGQGDNVDSDNKNNSKPIEA